MAKVFQVIILLSFIILFSSLLVEDVSAIRTFSQNSDIELKIQPRVGGGIANNVLCNLSVSYPNQSILVDWQPMTDSGNYFNYTLWGTDYNLTGLRGKYEACYTCTNQILNETQCEDFLINRGGIEPSEERTHTQTRTIFIFFGLAILFFIALFFTRSFPIKLTFFLLMVWFILIGVDLSYIALEDEIVNSSIENFFSFFLTLSFYANYFIFLSIAILWFITFIVNVLQFKQMRKEGKYGFEGIQ